MTYDKNNIFAKIIRGEIDSIKIFEDDRILAFEDISKAAPIHVLIIPKGEYISFTDFVKNAPNEDISYFFKKTGEIAKMLNIEESGYRLITNNGKDASQEVSHFHIHLLGKIKMKNLIPKNK